MLNHVVLQARPIQPRCGLLSVTFLLHFIPKATHYVSLALVSEPDPHMQYGSETSLAYKSEP